ncbi:cyanophycinase [Tepidimonas alkaliphilus]|uniref:cyanophycinase n=1 Tax=Tepidimonas alkaliphilus TaxID=2588942 RepID=UPI00163DDA8F|nr:cyanophycinase [Tepidimonas alkaliphilus]
MAASARAATPPRRYGHLLAVGGAEDRERDRLILRRFIELSGGPQARLLVLTVASSDPAASWEGYRRVFEALGAQRVEPLDLREPAQANDPAVVDRILDADGIYLSGGDQRRLMGVLWESAAARALHLAFHVRGCCIGGTSAGAAALSRQMLAIGEPALRPYRDAVSLDIGLGLLASAIIDQHFNERHRLARLLSALALRPDLLGVGIDEDTALLIERGRSVEVLGNGAVTLVDARQMRTNVREADPEQPLQMLDVRLHLLPAGTRYEVVDLDPRVPAPPPALRQALELLVRPGPIRG